MGPVKGRLRNAERLWEAATIGSLPRTDRGPVTGLPDARKDRAARRRIDAGGIPPRMASTRTRRARPGSRGTGKSYRVPRADGELALRRV